MPTAPICRTSRMPSRPMKEESRARILSAICAIRSSTRSSAKMSRPASATAHPSGLAVKECPWKKVLLRSSLRNPSYTVSEATVTASGRYPAVRPFDRQMMSGSIGPCSQANIVPVRPKPVMTSSAINRMPWASQSSLSLRRKAGFQTSMPPAAWSMGSAMTAAISWPRRSSNSSSVRNGSVPVPSRPGTSDAR